MIKIEITDSNVLAAFNRLIAAGQDTRPALKAIGEKVAEFTKTRFALGADPYGTPWAPNSDTTLRNLLAGKKPLIGASKSLSTQFSAFLGEDSVTVASTMKYAAMQNFGGTRAKFPHLWGDIPARPFFPSAERGLPEPLKDDILAALNAHIAGAIR